ncbi:MAG: 50S ribosomal protein L18 [Patescibacteria group bacterium]|nr:50S ribosomal protein L18 [Patescibacteria group bacterium]
MNRQIEKQEKKERRAKRVRARVSGTALRPRLSIFRSNRHIFAQIVDDTKGLTLVSAHTASVDAKGKKSEVAFEAGKELAKRALEKNITTVVFDRGGNIYHGRIQALADGAREGGLIF